MSFNHPVSVRSNSERRRHDFPNDQPPGSSPSPFRRLRNHRQRPGSIPLSSPMNPLQLAADKSAIYASGLERNPRTHLAADCRQGEHRDGVSPRRFRVTTLLVTSASPAPYGWCMAFPPPPQTATALTPGASSGSVRPSPRELARRGHGVPWLLDEPTGSRPGGRAPRQRCAMSTSWWQTCRTEMPVPRWSIA